MLRPPTYFFRNHRFRFYTAVYRPASRPPIIYPVAHGRGILKSERRRRKRVAYSGSVILCWTDDHGHEHYGRGRCLDLSENGCALELMEPIPLRTNVSMRLPETEISSFASVRHVTRKGSKYIAGLEFPQAIRIPLKDDVKDDVKDDQLAEVLR